MKVNCDYLFHASISKLYLCKYVGSHILVNSRCILTLAVAGFLSTILLQYLTDGGIF